MESPLGPWDLGDLFSGVFRVYRYHLVPILLIVAVIDLPLQVLNLWLISILEADLAGLFTDVPDSAQTGAPAWPELSRILPGLSNILLAGSTFLIATWLGYIAKQGALTFAVSEHLLSRPIGVARAFRFVLSRFRAMLGASLLSLAALSLLAITIIGIPLAIYFGVKWYFAIQTASLEHCRPAGALARSSELVQGNWWRVLGILLLVVIITSTAGGILDSVLGLLPYLGGIIAGILISPAAAIPLILLYHDLRLRRDTGNVYAPSVLAADLDGPHGP